MKNKWTSTAEPRQTKKVSDALAELNREHYRSEERGMVITRFVICGENDERADVRAVQDRVFALYSGTITRENHKDIIASINEAMPGLVEARPSDEKKERVA